MLPILLVGTGLYLWHKHASHKSHVSTKPVPTPVLRAHGYLMGAEWDPKALEQAARKFRADGFHPLAHDLQFKASEIKKQIRAIPEVCKRARALDENAMAMLAGIENEARQGSTRAKLSQHLVERWCQANPPPALGPHGEPAEEAA